MNCYSKSGRVSEVKFMGYDEFKQVVINKDKNFWIYEEGFTMLFNSLDNYLMDNCRY